MVKKLFGSATPKTCRVFINIDFRLGLKKRPSLKNAESFFSKTYDYSNFQFFSLKFYNMDHSFQFEDKSTNPTAGKKLLTLVFLMRSYFTCLWRALTLYLALFREIISVISTALISHWNTPHHMNHIIKGWYHKGLIFKICWVIYLLKK